MLVQGSEVVADTSEGAFMEDLVAVEALVLVPASLLGWQLVA
jgi:hypothetical protein